MAIGWFHSADIGSSGVQIKVNPAKILTSIEEERISLFGIASYSNINFHILTTIYKFEMLLFFYYKI